MPLRLCRLLDPGQIRQRRDVVSGAAYYSQGDVTSNSGPGVPKDRQTIDSLGQWGRRDVLHPAVDKSVTIIQCKGAGK